MTPSQHVALAGVAFCVVVLAAVYWRHPALWCAWVQAWTRREPDLSPERVAHSLVEHAVKRGPSSALGWRVAVIVGGQITVQGPGPEGRSTVHRTAREAEARIVREWR